LGRSISIGEEASPAGQSYLWSKPVPLESARALLDTVLFIPPPADNPVPKAV